MFLEGPIITYIASIAAGLGLFNIFFIFGLSVLGNTIPDIIYYWLGRKSRTRIVEKFIAFFGINKKRVNIIEKHLKKHAIKTIITIKLTPIMPGLGLFLAGFVRIPFKKFIITGITCDIICSFIFCILGFYSGIAIDKVSRFLKLSEIIIPAFVILVIIFFVVLKFMSKKLEKSKKLELKID